MPCVNIYRGGQQIEAREFDRQFFISGSEVLFWQADEDKDWATDERNSETLDTIRNAQRQITLINTHKGYELSPILPTWNLWVNQEECERGFYGDTLIIWREIKLLYRDYEFIFLFEQGEKENDNAPLPKPLLHKGQIEWDYWDHL